MKNRLRQSPQHSLWKGNRAWRQKAVRPLVLHISVATDLEGEVNGIFRIEKAVDPDYFQSVKRTLGLLIILNAFFVTSCGYNWGFGDRELPGGYREVAIPMFKNESTEVGIEADFTRSLIQRFERSQVAVVKDKDHAPLVLRGTITKVDVVRGLGASKINQLPTRAVLNTEYVVTAHSTLSLVRQSDQKVLWSGSFEKSKVYLAPRIGTEVVNSANALYNSSERRLTLTSLADEMMREAHDRMTESF
jgi:hypothetical protein